MGAMSSRDSPEIAPVSRVSCNSKYSTN